MALGAFTTTTMCTAVIMTLGSHALDVVMLCFQRFIPRIHSLTLQITMLKVEQGFGGERKVQRQGYFVDISIIRIGNLIVDVGVQDLHSW